MGFSSLDPIFPPNIKDGLSLTQPSYNNKDCFSESFDYRLNVRIEREKRNIKIK